MPAESDACEAALMTEIITFPGCASKPGRTSSIDVREFEDEPRQKVRRRNDQTCIRLYSAAVS